MLQINSESGLSFFVFAKGGPKIQNTGFWPFWPISEGIRLAFFSIFSIFFFIYILKALCLLSKNLTLKNTSGLGKWPKMATKVPKWPKIAFFDLKKCPNQTIILEKNF